MQAMMIPTIPKAMNRILVLGVVTVVTVFCISCMSEAPSCWRSSGRSLVFGRSVASPRGLSGQLQRRFVDGGGGGVEFETDAVQLLVHLLATHDGADQRQRAARHLARQRDLVLVPHVQRLRVQCADPAGGNVLQD